MTKQQLDKFLPLLESLKRMEQKNPEALNKLLKISQELKEKSQNR